MISGTLNYLELSWHLGGPGSSVGRATEYGLGGPGSNAGGDEIFRPSRQAVEPIKLPVKWVQSVSRGYSAVGLCC